MSKKRSYKKSLETAKLMIRAQVAEREALREIAKRTGDAETALLHESSAQAYKHSIMLIELQEAQSC